MDDDRMKRLRADGLCIIPDALSPDVLERARAALALGVEQAELRGTAHDPRIDPNPANRRIYNLPAVDPVFIELLLRADALAAARAVVGPDLLISNFTANIALPGSGSMRLHSDQALVVPPPWLHPWAVNVIWCLDDVDAENGATRWIPGSHRWRDPSEVPGDALARAVPVKAGAGACVVLDGRVWHTSGANVSRERIRRMLFAYYAVDFLRPQANWNAALPPAVQDGLDEAGRALFGLGPAGNVRIGGGMTRL